jgi:hypothetical protein
MSTDSIARQFSRFHDACRYYHARGLSKTEAVKTAQMHHPDLNRAFCQAQERHEAWTREPLFMTEEKRLRNEAIIRAGGRLP